MTRLSLYTVLISRPPTRDDAPDSDNLTGFLIYSRKEKRQVNYAVAS